MTDQPTNPATTTSAREILPVLLTADPYIPEVHDDEDDVDATAVVLDDIATRAAHLHEYADLPPDADLMAGQDVPALLALVGRLRAERDDLRKYFDQAIAGFNASAMEIHGLRERVAELEGRPSRAEVLREAADHLADAITTNPACRPELHPGVQAAIDELRRMAAAAPAGAEDGDQ